MNNLVKPYDEHYMNCYLNNLFSISYTINPKSKMLSYINDYNITIEKLGDFKYLQFDYSESFYSLIYERVIGIKCKSSFDIYTQPLGSEFMVSFENVSELSSKISGGNVVFLLVDLFYLNNGNIFFSNIHRQHFLMLVDWNIETRYFTVIDDGNKGYGYYSISLLDMELLMRNGGQAYCLKLLDHKSDDLIQLSTREIILNSKRICKQIHNIEMSFHELSFPKNYSELCQILIFVQRCFNRQVCNEHLLKYYIDNISNISRDLECLVEKNSDMKSLWYNMRAIILRHMATGKIIDFEAFFSKTLEGLNTELMFWNLFCQAIKE